MRDPSDQRCQRCGCTVPAGQCTPCAHLLRHWRCVAESDRRCIAWSWVVLVAAIVLALAVALS